MNNKSISGARYKTAQSTAQALIIINLGFFFFGNQILHRPD